MFCLFDRLYFSGSWLVLVLICA